MRQVYFKTSVAKAMRNPIEPAMLETCLLLVDCEVPREILCQWTVKQRAIAEDWAIRLHLRASDNIVRVPQKPGFVTRAERSKIPRTEPSLATKAVLERKATGTLRDVIGT